MKKLILLIIVLLTISVIVVVIFTRGSKEKNEQKSMESIIQKQGVPVETIEIKEKLFTRHILFNATVKGYKQTNSYSPIGAAVERINAKVGDYVQKDSIIIEFPKDKPSAGYIQTESAYKNALATYNRLKTLYEKGGVSKQDLDNAETGYLVAKANWNSALKMVNVKAPIEGTITSINVQETHNVKEETVLFTISNTSILKAILWATDSEVKTIKKGQKALLEYRNAEYIGKVTQVSISMDEMKKGFAVFVEFDNKKGIIPSGIFVPIKIIVYENKLATTVPRKLIQKDDGGSFIFIANDKVAKKVYIKFGKENSYLVEIIEPILKGEKLITTSINQLFDNTKINIVGR